MKEKKEAISGTVTGNDQHVGFRAMIMKQAIEYNLAGFTKNLPNDVVSFVLQGDGKRLNDAVSAVQEGTKKSSDIKVSTAEDKVDPSLNAFTIFDWTSTTLKYYYALHSCLPSAARRRTARAGECQDCMARHSAIHSERRRPEETGPRRLSSIVWDEIPLGSCQLCDQDQRLPQGGHQPFSGGPVRPPSRPSRPFGQRSISAQLRRPRLRSASSAQRVRRDKAALSSGCEPHPANAPAGSNRSSHGGDEMAEAFGVAGHI